MASFESHPDRHPHLKLDGRCPICNATYDFRRLKILGEHDQHVLTYIDCHQCGGAIVSILTLSPMGMTALGLLTDLTSDEVLRTGTRDPVTSDEVLDLHSFLDHTPAPFLDINH